MSRSVTQLERLPRPGALDAALVQQAAAAVAAYLDRTRLVHLVRCDVNGGIQFTNAVMAEHLGLSAAAACGLPIASVLVASDAALVRQRLDGGPTEAAAVNLNFCDAAGSPFTLSCHVTRCPDGCLIIGEPAVEHDAHLQRQLTEVNVELAALVRTRHRSTMDEQRGRQQAETDSRAKDDALAVLAHELRQPLAAMRLALSVVTQNPSSDRALRVLDRQVSYMATLVEELLHASELMRGGVTITPETADLRQLVRDAAEAIDGGVTERGQQLVIETPDTPLIVIVDTGKMRQILSNILTNAMKYTPEGGAIAVVVEAAGDRLCRVRVRDTGQGLAPEALQRVFELFARATSGGNGLGIGLAVAKRLVELHHGVISVTSEGLGRGAEFVVTLPRETGTTA